MSWLLLFALLATVVCIPMLPALIEWARPTDAEPLHIDRHDALDPPYLATSFATKLADAILNKRRRLGPYELALAAANPGGWSFNAKECRQARSSRAWHGLGEVTAPAGVRFLAPVAAKGALSTASDATYHSLWAGAHLTLAPNITLLRWAHGDTVFVDERCQLKGRVTASRRISISGECSFALLHAPVIEFGEPTQQQARGHFIHQFGLPPTVQPDSTGTRSVCNQALTVGAQRSWSGDLVCRDDLVLGNQCEANGSIKSHGDMTLGDGCSIKGNLVAGKALVLGAGCAVSGAVIAEESVVLGPGCTVGSPASPATVSAPQIEVADGVVVYGTLWAGKAGVVMGPETPEDSQANSVHIATKKPPTQGMHAA